jgi:hypothetical protein
MISGTLQKTGKWRSPIHAAGYSGALLLNRPPDRIKLSLRQSNGLSFHERRADPSGTNGSTARFLLGVAHQQSGRRDQAKWATTCRPRRRAGPFQNSLVFENAAIANVPFRQCFRYLGNHSLALFVIR